MNPPLIRSYREYLCLGSLLSCVAGVVNAVGFVAFGGFVTHVSGNATRAAVEYSEGHMLIATVFAIALFFFISGAFTTTLLLRGHSIDSPRVSFGFPLILEAFLIGIVAYVASHRVGDGESLVISRAVDAWFLNALTFAMGMQNAIIRQGSGIIIRTTHMTGIVTDVGIALGSVASRLFEETIKSPQQAFQRRTSGPWTVEVRHRFELLWHQFHLERFFLHIAILLSFLTGAVLGTFGYLRVGFQVLSGPLTILVLLAALEFSSSKKRTEKDGHTLQNAG